ncbi:hypothetical protein DAEQUDRAFT_733302 [Daedalea quercina L-15889]|uniref:Uncharacterized protein n=1 Tax=Daedalea quercina L-15889 TaxID=1314783 RepID=A0A165L3U4_9APHY|nr:hypothetical protein DAEQUDRAFT_733302 [Daedalea quercina L-15889]
MESHLPDWRRPKYNKYALCGVMRELSTSLPSSVDSFIINGALHFVDTETWDHMLAAFPCVERLKFLSSVAGARNLSSALKPTASVVPCPRLL